MKFWIYYTDFWIFPERKVRRIYAKDAKKKVNSVTWLLRLLPYKKQWV